MPPAAPSHRSGRYKSSCKQCSRAKKKCDGLKPCAQCDLKGLKCEFELKSSHKSGSRSTSKKSSGMKRMRPPKGVKCFADLLLDQAHELKLKGEIPVNPPKHGLTRMQKWVWEVFFSLYKHHASNHSCCKAWFTKQLNKMCAFLLKEGKTEAVEPLAIWMQLNDLRLRPPTIPQYFANEGNWYSEYPAMIVSPVHAQRLTQMSNLDELDRLSEQDIADPLLIAAINHGELNDKYPAVKFISRHENSDAKTNKAFESVFGLSGEAIGAIFSWTLGGFLPYGGDLFSLILSRKEDILKLIRGVHLALKSTKPSVAKTAAGGESKLREVFTVETCKLRDQHGSTHEYNLSIAVREYFSLEQVTMELYLICRPCKVRPKSLFESTATSGASSTSSESGLSPPISPFSHEELFASSDDDPTSGEEGLLNLLFDDEVLATGEEEAAWLDEMLDWTDRSWDGRDTNGGVYDENNRTSWGSLLSSTIGYVTGTEPADGFDREHCMMRKDAKSKRGKKKRRRKERKNVGTLDCIFPLLLYYSIVQLELTLIFVVKTDAKCIYEFLFVIASDTSS